MSKEDSRWTYTNGSRPEGVIVYDGDLKLHSHHDTDPARGQHSAWDLVRLHRFGHLDAGVSPETPISARASSAAMVGWANTLPEINAGRAGVELHDLGELPAADSRVESGVADVTANSPTRFQVYSASEFGTGAPLEWLVRRVLPRAELAVVFGESGSGKSFLALDLCAAITRGLGWRNNRTVRGGVVYVCAEGARGFKARLRAYALEHKVELAQLPAVIADAPNLLEPKDAAALTFEIIRWVEKQGKVDVVVIDTMAAVTPGGNENSAEDVGLVLSHCKLINRETGALVVMVTHSGKSQDKGIRGWSGTWAAADVVIEITREGDFRRATVRKLKDGEEGAVFPFKLRRVVLGRNSEGEEESSCVVEHVDSAPEADRSSRKLKLGPREQMVFDLIKMMAPSGTMSIEDLVEGYKSKIASDGEKRDQRRAHAVHALNNLIAKGKAFKHGEHRVSLTSLVTTGDDGWLQ